MKLLIGTANKGKIIEMKEALSGLPVEIITTVEISVTDIPEENGATFAENASGKAQFYYECSGLPTLADDSGIIVDAMKDELGIHTRRWGAGKDATDAEWIGKFLERMEREPNRRAHFICVLSYIDADGAEHLFEGRCDGEITRTLEAAYLPGLPISACFKPDGSSLVYSALPVDEKNRISHRGHALQQFRRYLEQTMLH